MPIAAEHQHLVKWPTREEDMSADLMLRILGAETQRMWLEKWRDIEADGMKATPLYFARTNAILSAVGLMLAIVELKGVHPSKADAFARAYWSFCDAGDSVGELLSNLTQAAGLDPELVTLEPAEPPRADPAEPPRA